MRTILKYIISIMAIFLTFGLYPWTNHFYGTYLSLEPMVEFKRQVEVESIESFLAKEGDKLADKLDEIEAICIKNIKNYPKRPDGLRFNSTEKKNLRQSFLRAIRVNPTIKLALYYQELPTKENLSKKSLPYTNITIFSEDVGLKKYIYTELKEKSKIEALHITSSAADEPDYGLDIHLFSEGLDKDQFISEWGKDYNFGPQAFGDPKLFYGTQAPFHMAFYHESFITYAAASWVKKTYPEMRILQYYHLSKFAFETGHDYWGYRFLGWALHYVGDLTQPYHSTLTPGIGTTRKIFAEIFSKKTKEKYRNRVSDRHTAIEHYQFFRMKSDLGKNPNSPLLIAYKNTERDNKFPPIKLPEYIFNILTVESNKRASDLDDVLDDNPEIMKFATSKDVEDEVKPNAKTKETEEFLEDLFISFGAHTRNFARSVIPNK